LAWFKSDLDRDLAMWLISVRLGWKSFIPTRQLWVQVYRNIKEANISPDLTSSTLHDHWKDELDDFRLGVSCSMS